MSDLNAKIKTIIAEQLGAPLEQITDQAKLIEDLGADSLDTVELVMALEEGFDIEIPDEVAAEVKTVDDIIKLIAAENA